VKWRLGIFGRDRDREPEQDEWDLGDNETLIGGGPAIEADARSEARGAEGFEDERDGDHERRPAFAHVASEIDPLGEASEQWTEDEDEYDWPEPLPKGPSVRERLSRGGGFGSRLLVAIPGVLVAIGVVVLGGGIFAAVVGLLAILAMFEFYSLTAAWRPLRWAGYVGLVATIALAWGMASPDRGVLLGLAIGMGCVALAGLLVARRDDITGRMATTALGFVYIALPFGLLVATRQLPHGGGAVANVLVGTWVFDTASFLGGKLWGRHKIAPFISPGKTLEGLITGVIVGTASVWVAGLYMTWISGWDSLIVGLVICLAGFVGDLFESMLKRDIGVKDSGRLLMAHGGVLDRFDALMFATVAAYFVTVALH
jgi:phosphatidate cytidylyltransferase